MEVLGRMMRKLFPQYYVHNRALCCRTENTLGGIKHHLVIGHVMDGSLVTIQCYRYLCSALETWASAHCVCCSQSVE